MQSVVWVLARILSEFMLPDAAELGEALVAMAALKGPLACVRASVACVRVSGGDTRVPAH